jgi:hypothetical protein
VTIVPVLWKAYTQLTRAEAAIRIHKDQLEVRPIWHQRADRVQALSSYAFSPSCRQQRAGLGKFAAIHDLPTLPPICNRGE